MGTGLYGVCTCDGIFTDYNGKLQNLESPQYSFPSPVEAAPVYYQDSNGQLYLLFSCDDGNVYCYSGSTSQTPNWKFNIGNSISLTPSLVSSPAVANGIVYVGSDNGTLYAIDVVTGLQLWTFQVKQGSFGSRYSIQSSVAVGIDGTVYLGPADGNVYALNGQTGAVIWQATAGGTSSSSPALGPDGSLYVGTGNSVVGLYGLDVASVTISPAAITPGGTATGTVVLSSVALTPTVVNLSNSDPTSASIPTTVTVPAQSQSATFPITTTATPTLEAITVGASIGAFDVPVSGSFTIIDQLKSLSLDQASWIGGSNVTGSITLVGPAPAGGLTVTLTSSNTTVVTSTSVAVLEGQSTAKFQMPSNPVSANAPVTITASAGGVSSTGTITILAPVVSAISFTNNVKSIVGGQPGIFANGTVTLNGPAPSGGLVVTFTSNQTAIPVASVTVAQGSTTASFTAEPGVVSSSVTATITPSPALTGISTQLTDLPLAVSLLSVPSAYSGQTVTGTVTLNGYAGTATTITVTSNGTAVSILGVVTVAANDNQATFSMAMKNTRSTPVTVTITAVLGSTPAITTQLMVYPALKWIVLALPKSVIGGATASGVVTLSTAASIATTISLKSDSTADATPPASVVVPAGSQSANFTVPTKAVTTSQSVTITGTFGTLSNSATLSVLPLAVTEVNSLSIVSGSSATLTMTLNTFATVNTSVAITYAKGASGPSSVTVPAGQLLQVIVVSTVPSASAQSYDVKATLGKSTATGTVKASALTMGLGFPLAGVKIGGTASCSISISSPVNTNLTFSFSASSVISFPSTVVLLAGRTNVTFLCSATSKAVVSSYSVKATCSNVSGLTATSSLKVTK